MSINLQHTVRNTRHLPLIIILVLFAVLTAYQSVVLPIGEAADETDHYQYHRFVARTGHPPLTAKDRTEAGFKGGLAPLYYWLTAWPVVLAGEDSLPDVRRVDAKPERHIPTDGLGINHVLHTLDEQWPWRGQPLAWHLVRFLSLPMGLVTIIATYALVRQLAPKLKIVAIGAAGFVAFLPRFVISSAVINDDNLVFALTALLLLTQVIILKRDRPPSSKLMAIFGALFGLALVTKYFSLILIPEIILTLLFAFRSRPHPRPLLDRRKSLLPFLSFLMMLFFTAGIWFLFIVIRFNRVDELGLIPGLAASLGEPQITEGLVGLLSGQSIRPAAATYSLQNWFSLLYRSFWFEYGWMRVFAPTWIYAAFTLFLLPALGGLTWKILVYQKTDKPASPVPAAIIGLLALHLLLYIAVVLIRYSLSATIDTGQGRHLYPALPVIALLVSLGLAQLHNAAAKHRLSATRYLLPAICFLLPAISSLTPSLSARHLSRYISPHYVTHSVTGSPAKLPNSHRLDLEFAPGLSLVGIKTDRSVSAGSALPVTLYWHAEKEATRDYLVSLCLQDTDNRPVACSSGHFADGRYPARAWESGDTLIDTIAIPIPTCYRIFDTRYTLRLEVWSLDPMLPTPQLKTPVALQHHFTQPKITIRPTDSLRMLPQITDLWGTSEPLIAPATIQLNQSVTQIIYATHNPEPNPVFTKITPPFTRWPPMPQLNTNLYLPCDDGPAPFAHQSQFIAAPTLTNGIYHAQAEPSLPNLAVSLRTRTFAAMTSTLTFSNTLAPLSMTIQEHPIALNATQTTPTNTPVLPITGSHLPVTVRWQARHWMAEPLVIALKLLDKDFSVGGERITTLGNRYPNVLWVPTETVEESYSIQIKPDAPPGLYRLEAGLLRLDETLPNGYENLPVINNGDVTGDNLYPATVRLTDPARSIPPPNSFTAQLGDSIWLTGYDINLENLDSRGIVEAALVWKSTAKIAADYTVFTQLLGPDGQVWAQWDNPPQAGRYPTTAWAKNDTVVDRYTLTLHQEAPSGSYRLLVGMYNSATGQRLPALIEGQPQPNNALEVTTINVNR